MCDKMAISAYILKIVEKDPFLRLQMRAKEMFNRHQFFWLRKTEKIPNVTSKFLSHVRTRLLNMTWSNLSFNV